MNTHLNDKISDNLNVFSQKTNDIIIKTIFQQAIESDSWILKIYQLSLSKSAKRIIMNSWKENIDSHKIYLNLRNECKFLYSKTLDNMIQIECNNILGISIEFRIEENSNFLKKTPIELIYSLYTEKISKLKQEFLIDHNVILIQSFFEVEFNEEDIDIFA